MTTWLTFQYTLTETHVGGSGAVGATDLPIAREATTDLPFLPDTALKGVARDAAEATLTGREVDDLFGWVQGSAKDVGKKEGTGSVGALSFTQGHLLLYPLRSLQRPFVYATSPLLLGRLARLVRAFSIPLMETEAWKGLLLDGGAVRVADKHLGGQPLVLEGTAFGEDQVRHDGAAAALGAWLSKRMPDKEDDTGARIARDLVVLPDAEFVHLVRSAPPVRARVSLNDRKTTTGDGGNLWYEEMLPSDCLFWSIVSTRASAVEAQKGGAGTQTDKLFKALLHTQIGGGESTGHGRCWWWHATPKG